VLVMLPRFWVASTLRQKPVGIASTAT